MFSRHATRVELLLYEGWDSQEPFQTVLLDPAANCTFFFWHVYVEALGPGVFYAWRVDGPSRDEQTGCHFDPRVELLDPWARATSDTLWRRHDEIENDSHSPGFIRAAVVRNDYDWGDDQPLNHRAEDTIVYEAHVGGFTRHPSSGVQHPGTFRGFQEKIPYLRELGVTDVELMPIMAFDEQHVPRGTRQLGLRNFWGYSTHSFFSPHSRYCAGQSAEGHADEFRDLVKALHAAGIGVILDVVINHTAEGGADGPIINFKGFANRTFYHLDPEDPRTYLDFTGCGNTMNCNHPLVTQFILSCLEYWVEQMHVDGFRFDLASVLARGEDGRPMWHAPVLWMIEFSEKLAETRIIAEAWDAAGLYQVGAFPGFRWREWNGKYRDTIRAFVRGEPGLLGEVATRMSGSSDLYGSRGRTPTNSVNYVTCHDGFTLHDLVSYNEKHNLANGENNRDGSDYNLSWNCGVEGSTEDPFILGLRNVQARNFMAVLMLSQGIPMILAGDEVLRSQRGNNNAYCQDNELSWFDWDLVAGNRDFHRFVTKLIQFRKRHTCLRRRRFLTGKSQNSNGIPDIAWHGCKLNEPLWDDPDARVLAFTLAGVQEDDSSLHVMVNMSESAADMDVPRLPRVKWCRAIDTRLDPPADILDPQEQPTIRSDRYRLQPRSIVVLESRRQA
jgi:glycogen operon protein